MRPTREGKRFLLATFLIAVAAVNTGNNLIYLILSMMLSILTISLAVLSLNLRGLTLSVSVQHPIFVRGRAIFKISISNRKRLLPSYSIRVHLPEGIKGAGYMPYISSSSEISMDVSVLFERRGIYRYDDFIIESGFPFILFTKKIKSRVSGEIIVYPEIKEVDGLLPELTGRGYGTYITRPGTGEELSMIRDFRYGDDMRRIHWKASAKAGKPMVKEFGIEDTKILTVILDTIRPLNKDIFEKAVSLAASVSDRLLRDGFFVRLMTCRKLIPFGSGSEHLFKILDILAVIEEEDTWECLMTEEIEGASLLILKSEDSPLKKMTSHCDMVIYATAL